MNYYITYYFYLAPSHNNVSDFHTVIVRWSGEQQRLELAPRPPLRVYGASRRTRPRERGETTAREEYAYGTGYT